MASLPVFLHSSYSAYSCIPAVLVFRTRAKRSEPAVRTGPNEARARTHRTLADAPEIATTRSLTLVLMPSHHLPSMRTHRTALHNHTPSACSFRSVQRVPGEDKYVCGCGRCLCLLVCFGPRSLSLLVSIWLQLSRQSMCPSARSLPLARGQLHRV